MLLALPASLPHTRAWRQSSTLATPRILSTSWLCDRRWRGRPVDGSLLAVQVAVLVAALELELDLECPCCLEA